MFKCQKCYKSFKFKSHLERHENNKNSCNKAKEELSCIACNIYFKCNAEQLRHEKSKKHITNYNVHIEDVNGNINITNNIINNTTIVEDELKKILQQEYEDKYNDKLTKLQKENELLKFNFEEKIKINFDNEIEQELVPISTKIINYKTLNKINLNDILSKYPKLLNITDLLYIINYDLNKLYIDKFWNNIEYEDWIYLDDELMNWFDYKEISKDKEKIINLLKKYHIIEEDYKILNNEELNNKEEKRGGSNRTYILMNSDCFKNICMLVGTNKAKDIRQYYIEVEKIFKFYLKYTSEFNKYELEKSKLIKNRYINKSELKINSKLYVTTTLAKAKEAIFKFGSTGDEKARLCTYNTGHVEADKFFYVGIYTCYDAISLEKRIAKLLINFKIPNENEMYQLHFTALDNIIKEACKNDLNTMNTINKFISEKYDDYLNKENIIFL